MINNPAKSYFDLSGLSNAYNEVIDTLLSDCGLAIRCKIVKTDGECVECPNCIYNPMTKKSLNKYKDGGPIPFDTGITCPFCLGQGQSRETNEEYLNLFACWDSKNFISPFPGIKSPELADAAVQTVCRIEHYLTIISCDFIYFNVCDGCIESDKYKRMSKPQFAGMGRPKFIITNWSLVS